MSIKTRIGDGLGTQREASVTPANALLVQVLPQTSKGVPPSDLSNLRVLQEFFRTSAGSVEQRVVASLAAPVDFNINASTGITKWITGFRIIIEAVNFEISTQDFREYGAVLTPGLANGIQIEAFQSGVTTLISAEPIRVAGDYLQYSTSYLNFLNAISATADYFQVDFELETPVVLTEGSSDRVTIRVRDDLTVALTPAGTARQYAIARGYQEFA